MQRRPHERGYGTNAKFVRGTESWFSFCAIRGAAMEPYGTGYPRCVIAPVVCQTFQGPLRGRFIKNPDLSRCVRRLAILQRRSVHRPGTERSQTLCWREMDSNSRSPVSGDTPSATANHPLQPSPSAKARLALRTEGFDLFAEILRAVQAVSKIEPKPRRRRRPGAGGYGCVTSAA